MNCDEGQAEIRPNSYPGPLWNLAPRFISCQGRKSPGQNSCLSPTAAKEMAEVSRLEGTLRSHHTFVPVPNDPASLGWKSFITLLSMKVTSRALFWKTASGPLQKAGKSVELGGASLAGGTGRRTGAGWKSSSLRITN